MPDNSVENPNIAKKRSVIAAYLCEKYDPDFLIVYGSFADGSAGLSSDFDALLGYDGPAKHDDAVVDGTELDVFCYPVSDFDADFDPRDFLQVFDGELLRDRSGRGERLRRRVLDHIAAAPKKTAEEKSDAVSWCEKMLQRTARGDAEGFYRWHWLLTESLEICFDLLGEYYYGPKKSLRRLEREHPALFALYAAALRSMDPAALRSWIAALRPLLDQE